MSAHVTNSKKDENPEKSRLCYIRLDANINQRANRKSAASAFIYPPFLFTRCITSRVSSTVHYNERVRCARARGNNFCLMRADVPPTRITVKKKYRLLFNAYHHRCVYILPEFGANSCWKNVVQCYSLVPLQS